MREIKFRAWDKVEDCYVYPTVVDCLLMSYWVEPWSEGQDYCLEQYTGLKDANGVDIYERDIVESMMGTPYLVEWDDYGWYPFTQDRKSHRCSIVGNIHENPELLNETK